MIVINHTRICYHNCVQYNFTPQFSAGHQHYNFRNPTRLLPKIKHEFPRQSLRYRLIVTLNETSDDILEMATTQSQKCFIKFIRE